MPDVFLTGDLIFGEAAGAQEFCDSLSDEHSEVERGYAVEAAVGDGRYVSLSLEVFESFDLEEFVAGAERAGATALLLTQFDESREDEVATCRIDGKKARASSVQELIEKEAPAYRACELIDDGEAAALQKLLDDGLNVESRAYMKTLLIMAAGEAYKFPEIVELLLARGADPNALGSSFSWEPGDEEPEYVTPLLIVTKLGYLSSETEAAAVGRAMRALLDAGADPEDGGPGAGLTPLQSAVSNVARVQVELLLRAGVDPERVIPDHPISPLSIAFDTHQAEPMEQNSQILRLLLEAGADSTVTDSRGQAIGDVYDLVPELADMRKRGD